MNWTDEQIIDGWRKGDPELTQRYFYGYCQVAYNLLRQQYGLGSPALDFFAIAHELYLSLSRKQWAPLLRKPKELSLRSWIVNGFRFTMLDLMKTDKPCGDVDLTSVAEVACDESSSIRQELQELNDRYYAGDQIAHAVFQMMFIEGYSGAEVAKRFHISPSTVSQRYRKMMQRVVVPYFSENDACAVAPKGSSNIHRRICENRPSMYEPGFITSLRPNEIFVFGSNLYGYHDGGVAALAAERFGAKQGVGVGLSGQSYAIPTMQGGIETIVPYVDDFIEFAQDYRQYQFLVTAIGCGCAGFKPEEIAPLFAETMYLDNVVLPQAFRRVL